MERYQEIERSLITSYRPRIYGKFVQAVKEYNLIQDGDKIAVCISGGKDSMAMAKCFQELKKHGKDNFEVRYIVMNPGYSEDNAHKIAENASLMNIPIEMFNTEIFQAAESGGGDAPCYLCARMRRGHLYAKAKEIGCNKIALGHHFDDVIETILMGIFYNGQYQSMMPKLRSANFADMELIRPMYKVKEQDIVAWANANDLSFLRCACKFTERNGNPDGWGDSKRLEMKRLIKTLKEGNPNVDLSIFKSAYNINLNTVIGFKKGTERHYFWEFYDE